jgi:hypothetical protein
MSGNNPVGVINVQLGNQKAAKVQSIAYGQSNSLKNMADLNILGSSDGDVITYVAATNSFVVSTVSVKSVKNVDAGTF